LRKNSRPRCGHFEKEKPGRVDDRLAKLAVAARLQHHWIAATTLNCGAHLVTFDDDFERIPGLPHTNFGRLD